jgi:hypothetical protein
MGNPVFFDSLESRPGLLAAGVTFFRGNNGFAPLSQE